MTLLARIKRWLADFSKEAKPPALTAFELFRYIGPGLLVTVGFIDHGNWAANISSGAQYGSV